MDIACLNVVQGVGALGAPQALPDVLSFQCACSCFRVFNCVFHRRPWERRRVGTPGWTAMDRDGLALHPPSNGDAWLPSAVTPRQRRLRRCLRRCLRLEDLGWARAGRAL